MSATVLLTLILPHIPKLLELVAEHLDRAGRPVPGGIEKTEDREILDTVKAMVEDIGTAHPQWSSEDKRTAAATAIRGHLEKSGITLSDSQANLLVELYAASAAAQRQQARDGH